MYLVSYGVLCHIMVTFLMTLLMNKCINISNLGQLTNSFNYWLTTFFCNYGWLQFYLPKKFLLIENFILGHDSICDSDSIGTQMSTISSSISDLEYNGFNCCKEGWVLFLLEMGRHGWQALILTYGLFKKLL